MPSALPVAESDELTPFPPFNMPAALTAIYSPAKICDGASKNWGPRLSYIVAIALLAVAAIGLAFVFLRRRRSGRSVDPHQRIDLFGKDRD